MKAAASASRYLKTVRGVRIPVVSASWMVRHFSAVEAMLRAGPVLVARRNGQVLVAVSVLDFIRLANGLRMPLRLKRRYRALVEYSRKHPVSVWPANFRRAAAVTRRRKR